MVEEEFDAYGYNFPNTKERLEMLKESVSILKAMWTEEEASFDGNYYKIDKAICNSTHLQLPRQLLKDIFLQNHQ